MSARNDPAPAPVSMVRLKYSKRGDLTFVGHLDLMAVMTAAVRRAALPAAFTQGAEPRPRVSFGPPLSVGFSSEAEWFDVCLSLPVAPDAARDALNRALPGGLEIVEARACSLSAASLTSLVERMEYRIEFSRDVRTRLATALSAFHGSARVPVVHETKSADKTVDLKRAVTKAEFSAEGGSFTLWLSTTGGGVRPREAVTAIFGLTEGEFRALPIIRTAQMSLRGGVAREPWG